MKLFPISRPFLKDEHITVYRYTERQIYTRAVESMSSVLTAREHREYLAKSGPNRRREFLSGRICIKLALSHTFSKRCSFADIEIVGFAGLKPSITIKGMPLEFDHSLSHSGGIIFVAVARSPQASVGVDVEAHRSVKSSMLVFFLSADEIQHVRTVQVQNRSALALRYWTIKEAVLKAAGLGIMGNMKTIKVRSHNTSGAKLELSREWLQKNPYFTRQLSCHNSANDECAFSAIALAP